MTKQRADKDNSKARLPATELSDIELEQATAGTKAHDFPTETVSLNYGSIEWTYTQQKQ